MPSHFVSLQRGEEGSLYADYQTGTSTSGQAIELRLDDSVPFRPVEVLKALEAFERIFSDPAAMGASWICDQRIDVG